MGGRAGELAEGNAHVDTGVIWPWGDTWLDLIVAQLVLVGVYASYQCAKR